MKDIKSSFLGINPTGWLPHPISFLNLAKKFIILAKDEFRVSQIIENGDTVGTLFPVLKKYPESYKILKNFILEKIRKIRNNKSETQLSIFVRNE